MGNLRVFFSNRIENLLENMAENIRFPVSDEDIFAPEYILLDNKVLGQWLDIQFARKNGISANIEYIQPSQFFWNLAKSWVSEEIPRHSPFAKEVMAWRLFGILSNDNILDHADMGPVKNYLKGEENQSLKRYQLANSIADLFDQYLIYRPEWMNCWSTGKSVNWSVLNTASALDDINKIECWQRMLWRQLLQDAPQPDLHRAAVMQALHERLKKVTPDQLQAFGMKRLCVFGISSLPPSVLELLLLLGKHIPVNVYVLNPCEEFWFDIQSARDWVKACWNDANKKSLGQTTLDIGNPLLAANGQQVKEFINTLISLEGEAFQIESDLYQNPGNDSLLHCVQQEILSMTYCGEIASYGANATQAESARQLLPANEIYKPLNSDGELPSMHIHVCYSAMREVEVLHDQLLHLFKHNKTLKPRDVVVMMPDVSAYVPYIETVFANTREQLPYHITDRSRVDESPLLHSMEWILDLPNSRIQLSDVIAILEVPAVQARFNLSFSDFETLKGWLMQSGARWAIDGEHRQQLGLTNYDEFSWEFAMQRLWCGYAMSASLAGLDKNLVDIEDITLLPFDEMGESSVIFESFLRFWEKLLFYREKLAVKQTAELWSVLLKDIISDFYTTENTEKNSADAKQDIDSLMLYEIKDAINDLAEVHDYYPGDIDIEVIKAWLKPVINASSTGVHHWREGIKFCSLLPMRAVPFRVVYLMGMNMNDYPKRTVKQSFDLMRFQHKAGDRTRRVDDRWLFLEALLSARDYFYISYVGRNLRTNQECEPSVVVSELLDYFRQGYKAEGHSGNGNDKNTVDILCTEHPLQPFSERYFDHQENALFSYNTFAAEIATSSSGAEADSGWQQISEDAEKQDEKVNLNDFVMFFKDPAKWLFGRRYKTSLRLEDNVINDEEKISVEDGLEKWQLREEVYKRLQYANDVDEELLTKTIHRIVLEKKAAAEWPVGGADAVASNELLENISLQWVNAWHNVVEGDKLETRMLDINIATTRGYLQIEGNVECVNKKYLFHSVSEKKAKYELEFSIRACLVGSCFKDIEHAVGIFYKKADMDKIALPLCTMDGSGLLQVLAELYMAYREHGLPFEPGIGKELYDNLPEQIAGTTRKQKDVSNILDIDLEDIQKRAYYLGKKRLENPVFLSVCEKVWSAIDEWKNTASQSPDDGGESI